MRSGGSGGTVRRRVLAGAILALFLAVGPAGPASAGILSTLTSIVGGITSRLGLGPTEQRVDNVLQGTLGGVTGLVCNVGTNLPPPVNTGLCALGIVQMDIHSVYRAPNGQMLTRDTLLLPLVPTLVDVTNDGVPDVLALVTISSFNRFSLVVSKLPTTVGKLPVQIELVLRNPSAINSTSRIAAGFDARQTYMPSSFTASVSLLGFDPLHLGVTIDDVAPPPSMALIASIFDLGVNGARTESFHVRLDQTPVPTSAGYDLLLGPTHKHVTLTANQRSVAGLDLLFVAAPHVQTIKGTLNTLPSKVDLDIVDTDVNHRTFTYDAAQSIDDANLTYDDVVNNAIVTEIVAHVVGLPLGATFQQTGPLAYTLVTRGGAIGMVEGGFASGQHVVPMVPNESGGLVKVNGKLLSIGARIRGLTSFVGDFSNPYTADVMAAAQPMHAIFNDTVSGMHIDGHVVDLPKHIFIKVDPDHGHVEENGFGDKIARVDAVATKPSGLFASPLTGTPIRRLSAVVLGVPASFKLDYTFGTGGVFSVVMDNPATEIDFSGDDGSHLPALPTGAGIIYHDTAAATYAAGRVFGLTKVMYEPKPIKVTVQSAGSQDFSIDALLKMPASLLDGAIVKATGRIANLPSSVVVTVTTGTGVVDVVYTASSTINQLTLDATSSKQFFAAPLGGRPVSHIAGTLTGIPAAFNLHLDTRNGALAVTMDHPVTQIDAELDDGNNTAVFPSDAGADYTDTPSHFAAAARVFGITKVSYSPNPVTISYAGAPDHGFSVKGVVHLPLGTYPCTAAACDVTASAGILRMPATLDITATSTSFNNLAGPVNGMRVTYAASSGVSTLLVDATATQPFFSAPLNGQKVTHLHAQISSLPAAFTFNFESGGGAFSASMDHPAGQIDVQADDGGGAAPLPGSSGVDYTDTASHFAAAARVYGLAMLSYAPKPDSFAYAGAAGHTFSLAGTVDLPAGTYPCTAAACRVQATGSIEQLPATLHVVLEKTTGTDTAGNSVAGQKITYTASDPISLLWLDAVASQPFFSSPLTSTGIKHLHAQLVNVPASFTAKVAFGGGAFGVSLDNTVDTLQVEADDGVTGHDVGLRDNPGVTYNDVAGNFTAQLTIQKPTGFSFSPPLSVSYSGGAAQKFDFAARVDIAASLGLCTNPANARTACTVNASGTIDKLPSSMSLSTQTLQGGPNGYILNISSDGILHPCPVPLTDGSCRASGQYITYSASGPIDSLSFQATIETAGAALMYSPMTQSPVKHLQATLTTIPAAFQFTVRNGSATFNGPRMGFVGQMTQGSLGRVQLAADDGVSGHDPGLLSAPGATYTDVAGDFAAAVTLDGFSEINVSGNPFGLILKSGGATTFPLTAKVDLPKGTAGICPGTSACTIDATAAITPLPGTLQIDNSTDSAGKTNIDYSSSATINTLRLTATSTTANLLPVDKTCFDSPVGSACTPIRKLFAQVRQLPSKLHVSMGADAARPNITFSTEGGAVGDVWFNALDHSDADLVAIPTFSGGLLDASAVGSGLSSQDNDGFVFRDFPSSHKLTIAARLAGLQSVTFSQVPTDIFRFPGSQVLTGSLGISPTTDPVLNIDPTDKAFAIDMRTGSESSPTYIWGGLSNLPATVSFTLTSGKAVVANPNPPPSGKPSFDITQLYDKIAYSASDTIDEISLVTNVSDLPLATVNLLSLPKTLNVCLATSVYGDSIEPAECLPKRPSGYPADKVPDGTDPFLMGTGNGNNSDGFHQAIVDIDGSSEFRVKALVCIVKGDGCPSPSNLSDSFSHANSEWIVVNDMHMKKLMLDALAELSGGALISGHVGLDTAGNNAHGQLVFNDGSPDMYGGQVYALVTLADGFTANYMYTGWRNQPLTLSKHNDPGINELYNHNGSINCPAGTSFVGAFAPSVGGISFGAELTGREAPYRADEDYLGCGP